MSNASEWTIDLLHSYLTSINHHEPPWTASESIIRHGDASAAQGPKQAKVREARDQLRESYRTTPLATVAEGRV